MDRLLRRFTIAALLSSAVASLSSAEPLRWWKGNLHTHSLWSDGDDYPEMICEWYRSRGYHFLALSDHNIIADHERWIGIEKSSGGLLAFDKYVAHFGKPWVEEREVDGNRQVRLKTLSDFQSRFEEPGRFLLFAAEEITDGFLRAPVHVNVTNVRELIKPQGGESVLEVLQNNVNAVIEQRARTGVPMFPHINHPNFGWGITAEELAEVEHAQFFEVYNGHPSVNNEGDATHASVDRAWDIALTQRMTRGLPPFFGLATDDSHHYHEKGPVTKESRPGRGWVMVRAAALTPEALIAAMEAGDFYATSGVMLKEVRREGATLSLEIHAERGVNYRTEFLGTRKGYDPASEPVLSASGQTLRATRRYSSDIGATLATIEGASASYVLRGDELYVRARVTSSKVKIGSSVAGEFERAWTQPLRGGVAPEESAKSR